MRDAYLATIDRATLTPVVRRALRSASVEVADWHVAPVSAQGDAATGRRVYRVTGSGHDRGGALTWALILKVLTGPLAVPAPREEVEYWSYWRREALVYRAGLPADLTGDLIAPRCFDVVEWPGNVVWLWLEDLTDSVAAAWSVERYALAAHHLGGFNGRYLAGEPLPAHPWLSHAWLRSRTAALDARLGLVRRAETWAHPLIRRAFPTPVADRLLRLGGERDAFLQALARLPQTLCHLDAWRGNLFARRDPEGREQTVAIDWAFAGLAAVGEELAPLVWVAPLEFLIAPGDVARLEEGALAGYLAGLRDAGWRGDPQLVRQGYLIHAVLQYGPVPEALALALDEGEHAALERRHGRPIGELVERAAAVTSLLLDRAAELRALLAAHPP